MDTDPVNDPRWEGCICLQDEHHKNCPAIITGKCHFQSLYGGDWKTRAHCEEPPVSKEEVLTLRSQLAEAAREINCSGTVAHRIRVMKDEFQKQLELADELVKNDGHSLSCQFSGCTCGMIENYKVAKASYISARRQT